MNKTKTLPLIMTLFTSSILTGCFDNNKNEVKQINNVPKLEVISDTKLDNLLLPASTEGKEELNQKNVVVVKDEKEKSKDFESTMKETSDLSDNLSSKNFQPVTSEELPENFFAPLLEQKDYIKVAVNPSKNFVEANYDKPVIFDFFWYGCGHCNEMRPFMKNVVQKNPDFKYIKYPVAFPNWESGTKLFLTYKNMGVLEQLHNLTFEALHVQRKNLLGDKKQLDSFLESNKIDLKKFYQVESGFQMSRDMQKAKDVTLEYKLQSTPNMGVYYKGYAYMVNPSISKSYENTAKSLNTMLSKFSTEQINKK